MHQGDATLRGTAQTAIRVVAVDDHPAVRAGLMTLLADEPGIEVVATAATAVEGYDHVERALPDIAILDYHLPGEDGLSLCLRVKSFSAPPKVMILSAFADDALAVLARVAGADGLLSKGASFSLGAAAAALVDGETLIPETSPRVLQASSAKLDRSDLPILGMLINGVPADEIAETLKVEPAWLAVRRWGMLERLRNRPPRRAAVPRRQRSAT